MGKKELEWMSKHHSEIEKYSGKWIAILGSHVLATGVSVKDVMESVKKKHIKELPLVTKVPRKDEGMYIL